MKRINKKLNLLKMNLECAGNAIKDDDLMAGSQKVSFLLHRGYRMEFHWGAGTQRKRGSPQIHAGNLH